MKPFQNFKYLIIIVLTFYTEIYAKGQVVLDNSFGITEKLSGPNFEISDTMGKTIGNNLFHSFTEFNLKNGQSATFSGPHFIHNIFGRVTGRKASNIDGLIKSNIANANLFLINPNGFLFGKNASVSIDGALTLSTMDSIKLGDAGSFKAIQPDESVLTSAPPDAFGFLNHNPSGKIILDGTRLKNSGINTDINIISEKIQLTSEAEVINKTGGKVKFKASFIDIDSKSVVDADTEKLIPSGGVLLNGKEINILDESAITSNTSFSGTTQKDNNGKGGDIVINSELLNIDNSVVSAKTTGTGSGGDILINANELFMNGGLISSGSKGEGAAGNVTLLGDNNSKYELEGAIIETHNRLGLNSAGKIDISSKSLSLDKVIICSDSTSLGNSGDIELSANDLKIENNSVVTSLTKSKGDGGSVSLIGNDVNITSSRVSTDSLSTMGKGGDAGTISIKADQLYVSEIGVISSQSISELGKAGDIALESSDLKIDSRSLISVKSEKYDGGSIQIASLDKINISNSVLNAQAAVDGGNINITEANSVYIKNCDLNAESKQNGGNINVSSPNTMVLQESNISANAIFGNGGDIKIIANGYLPSLESVVTASSEYGVQGNIEINTPESNLTSSLVTLPDKIKDDSVKLVDRCTLNLSGEISSFFIKGQGGLPIWSRENLLPNSPR